MNGPNPRRLARLAILAVLCAGAGGTAFLLWPSASPPPAPVSAPAPAPASTSAALDAPAPESSPAPKPASPGAVPSFDLVRVGPRGAVLAGRAEPGATVVVVNNDAPFGRVQANGRGEWLLVSATSLAPGGRELSLSARNADGQDLRGDGTVLLDIPQAPSGPAMALLMPQSGMPRLLGGQPDDAPTPQAPPHGPTRLALNAGRHAAGLCGQRIGRGRCGGCAGPLGHGAPAGAAPGRAPAAHRPA